MDQNESLLPVRNSPAFWSYNQLAAHGVRNCTGFDAGRFRCQVRAWRGQFADDPAHLEALVWEALAERRRWFPAFARGCWHIPGYQVRDWLSRRFWSRGFKHCWTDLARTLRWYCAWFWLWYLERAAGLRREGNERPRQAKEEA